MRWLSARDWGGEISPLVFNHKETLLSSTGVFADKRMMKGLGQRLRARAKELGLADATIAERLGLSQQRYHNYTSDQTEPDFETLIRICRALVIEPSVVLGFTDPEAPEDESSILRDRISAAAMSMTPQALRISAAVVDTLAREYETASKPPTKTPKGPISRKAGSRSRNSGE